MAATVAMSAQQPSRDVGAAKITQLFDSPPASGLPDIGLRPDSASMEPRIKSATGQRSMSTSSTTAAGTVKISFPMTPAQALEKYKRVLTPFEQAEIMDYPQIYFLGPLAKKIQAGEGKGPNFGYDDDKGRYKLVKNDHIGYRFEVLKGLGKGSFGEVVRTFDHKTQQHFALKIIRNERRFHKQAQIEIKILEHLKREDKSSKYNLIHISEWFVFRDHICITFELLHCDLYSALKNDSFRGFGMADVQHFAYSLLTCMRMLRRNHIIHCDLKPENILLCKKDCLDIKVIDFGSACYDTQRVHTYIQSRFYRSPEVILGGSYGMPIDMWSLGCILVELLTGQPLFPGHDEKEQLLYQMEVLGLPEPTLLEKCKRVAIFFDEAGQPRLLTDHKGRRRMPSTRTLSRVLGRAEPEFEDFVMQCLRWDPDLRVTPKDALKHPWLSGVVSSAKLHRSISETATLSAMKALAGKDGELESRIGEITLGPAQQPLAAAGTYLPNFTTRNGVSGSSAGIPAALLPRSTGKPADAAPIPSMPPPPMPVTVQPAAQASSTVIPAALLPRAIPTKMTADQQAHADRVRSAGKEGTVARRPSTRDKTAV